MKFVVFGLTVSSSWGNGHATLWRGLVAALQRLGHSVHFFERDVPYYAMNRDLAEIPGGELVLYPAWDEIAGRAAAHLADADVAIVTSYCPDAGAATELVLDSSVAVRAFYDLDSPVTLERLRRGDEVAYLPARGLAEFDLVLSYAGGRVLDEMRERLGARRTVPLYGHVDPEVYRPARPVDRYRADLSYLGTYAEDRQPALESLFLEPARRAPERWFLIGGAQYPQAFPWSANIAFVRHVPPPDHAAFYGSSRLTLNVTRRAMAEMGHCPSGRLFEATACGAALVTDAWDGLERFFAPGEEILVARGPDDVLDALALSDAELSRVAAAARDRTLSSHTADRRAQELEAAVLGARDHAPRESAAAEGIPT